MITLNWRFDPGAAGQICSWGRGRSTLPGPHSSPPSRTQGGRAAGDEGAPSVAGLVDATPSPCRRIALHEGRTPRENPIEARD